MKMTSLAANFIAYRTSIGQFAYVRKRTAISEMGMAKDITIIISYYENPQMLARQYEQFSSFHPGVLARLSLTVIDDGSPVHAAYPPKISIDLSMYRMLVDVRWNQDACRNLGVAQANTKWLLLTDIDHLLPEETLNGVLALIDTGELEEDRLYQFRRIAFPSMENLKPHLNSFLMTKAMYQRIGGYDERLAGYYGTDLDFLARAAKEADTPVCLDSPLYVVLPETIRDARTRAYGRNEPNDLRMIPELIAKRKSVENWRPLNLSFPWTRTY